MDLIGVARMCPFGLNIFIDWPDRVAPGGIIRKEAQYIKSQKIAS